MPTPRPTVESHGRVYPDERTARLSDGPSASTCVFPTDTQADALAALLLDRRLRAVSIGAGDGYLEAQLEQRGVDVTAVDLDAFADPSHYATRTRRFCSAIVRIRPDALYALPRPGHADGATAAGDDTALLFIWGRTTPWRAYLERYSAVPLVVVAGDEPSAGDSGSCVEPSLDALDGEAGWRLLQRTPVRAIHPRAALAVYERVPGAASSARSSTQLH